MARMPGADYRPLAKHGGPMRAHDIACIHTMVGSLWGTDGYFQSGVANSHFGSGGDGHLVQWLDTLIESWANLDGNPDVITLENADMGPEFAPWSGSDVPEFTEPQAETIAHWLAWVCSPAAHADCPPSWRCHAEGIPLELIPDDRPGRRGVGYHRHGIDNWRAPAGVLWSSHPGKVCPGDRRIAQVPAIIARARQIANPQEDFLMALTDSEQRELLDAARYLKKNGEGDLFVHEIPARVAKLVAVDPKAIAAALAAELPVAGAASEADLEKALRNVLGSLDDKS